MSTNERLDTGRSAAATAKELTTTVTTLITKLEATHKELAGERQKHFYLSRKLENAMARLQDREKAKWRRALSLLLTVVVSAVMGAASFAVFLWLYNRGVITLG